VLTCLHNFSFFSATLRAAISPILRMFIIDLKYIVPLDKLDEHMTDHVKFLRKYYKLNLFMASGRKVPHTGGVILCLAKTRAEVDKIISEDPFHSLKLAEFTITEFLTSQFHPSLKELLKA
jgi:uncharacterized protein YciI